MSPAASLYALVWLLAPGEPPESYLGLHTAVPAFADEDLVADPDLAPGLDVIQVIENSPAEQAGFTVGDVLLRVNGAAPRTPEHLASLIAGLPPGSSVQAAVRRRGALLDLSAVTVPRLAPAAAPPARTFVEGRRFGLVLESLSTEEADRAGLRPGDGVRVVRRLEGGTAAGSALLPGDVITAVNGEAVHGGDDFLALMRPLVPGSRARLQVVRGRERQEVELPVRDPGTGLTGFHIPLIVRYEEDRVKEETTFGILLNIFKYTRKEEKRTYRFLWLIKVTTGSDEELAEVSG
jgi:S1-C subfamily serine protease